MADNMILTGIRNLKLRLMVDHRAKEGDLYHVPSSGELGVIHLTRMTLSTVDGTYTAHAPLQDWYDAIDPPKRKEVTTEEALLSAVNTSIWLPVMAWRDHLIETGAKEDVVYGLTWLIDHKKFPEEGRFESDNYNAIAYRWLVDEGDGYAAHRLPVALRRDIEVLSRADTHSRPGVVARVFKTIHQAFWVAAVSIAANKDKINPSPFVTDHSLDDDDDPTEYDSDWPEPESTNE